MDCWDGEDMLGRTDAPLGVRDRHDPHASIHGTKFAVGIIVLGVTLILVGLVAWWLK